MAKVSLRIYNREIEGMIDQGRTGEAIAHCHHILATFPKHLETYRLLGKSYLESKRYKEAVDVFGRVLMSVPDDFVAHVGMSIIHDEENKLDDAIWHMERAFEAKSANAAIQGELQRLYGRRDGMEPPKIRMTRGALAHMYVQGELYPQAIAEIRAVLAQDPQRSDMQSLLALSYFKGGQKSDASDMCAQLLKRYPYSYEANRIMAELLSATVSPADNSELYRVRVGELDPYATLAKGSVFQSNEVADAAISLDRLEYTGREEPTDNTWGSSLGLGATSVPALSASLADEQPDWLKSGGFSDTPIETSSVSTSAFQSNDEIPDFLRAAGWGESNTPEQPSSIFDEELAASNLAPAEMPDWLKGQVPATSSQSVNPPSEPAQSIMTPDWLSDLKGAPSVGSLDSIPVESGESSDTPDWLSGLGSSPAFGGSSTSEPIQTASVPDWLNGLGDSSQAVKPEQTTDVPDWLTRLDGSQTSDSAQLSNTPDWLNGLGDSKPTETSPSTNIPDWLNGLGEDSQTSVPNVPDWLGGMDKDQSSQTFPPSTVDLGASVQEQDDAVAWLDSLGAKHGAKPEELVIDPNNLSEFPAEWASQAQNPNQQEPVAQTSAAFVESLGSTAQEQDDAVAWLESLAAKHGAKPEELVTDPSKRFETPPEWVTQAQNLNQQEPVAQSATPSVESLGATAQEQDDAVAWLESLAAKHGAKPEELVTDPSKRFEKPPEWVSKAQSIGETQAAASISLEAESQRPEAVENALNIGEQFFAEFESASTPETVSSATDETGIWLRDLENKEKEEELSATKSNDVPDWLIGVQTQAEKAENQKVQHDDMPAWLSEAQVPADIEEPQSVVDHSDLPNWLSGIEEAATEQIAFSDQSLSNNDLSNWLSGLDDEPGLPFDALPTPDSILAEKTAQEISQKVKGKESDTGLPDWLNGIEAQEGDFEEDLWKKSFGHEPVPAASVRIDKPAPVAPVDQMADLPDWLQGEDEKAEEIAGGDDTPPWLHREKYETEGPQQPKPTSPSDWRPIEVDMSQNQPFAQTARRSGDVEQRVPQMSVSGSQATVSKKKTSLPAKPRQVEAQIGTPGLDQAKGELDRGDIPAALDHYGKLIKKGKQLEETIRDLTESLYRYPVEVGIWQTLGDAYMRANRLKEALEAYNKAEELIR